MDRRMTARYSGVSIGQSTDSEKAAHAESRSARGIDKRMRDCLASLLLLSCAAVPVAHGQDAAPNVAHTAQDGGIVVTGKGPEPIRKARRYLHQVLESDSGQLARFVDPVCPLVLGLPERFRAPIEERFRIVAAASSVRLARAKCQPNLMIVFADSADALIETMRKRRNAAFANLDEGALRDAFKAGPIHAWRLIVTRDDRGNIATGDEDPDFPTIFESETQTVTINSVIVIDKRAAQGKSVRQIAPPPPPRPGIDRRCFDPVALRSRHGAATRRDHRHGPGAARGPLPAAGSLCAGRGPCLSDLARDGDGQAALAGFTGGAGVW